MKTNFFLGCATAIVIFGLAAGFSIAEDAAAPKPADGKQQTVITADTMVLETKSTPNVATFEGNVVVTDVQFVLRCAKLVALLDGKTHKILRVEATGGVTVTQATRVGKAKQATYTPEDGKIVLEGDPRIESSEGTIVGKTITYFRDSEKVVVSGSQMEFAPEAANPPAPQQPQQDPQPR